MSTLKKWTYGVVGFLVVVTIVAFGLLALERKIRSLELQLDDEKKKLADAALAVTKAANTQQIEATQKVETDVQTKVTALDTQLKQLKQTQVERIDAINKVTTWAELDAIK